MILYLYALVDGLSGTDRIVGIMGEPLRVLSFHAITAVAGEIDTKPAIDHSTLITQDNVVRELHVRASAVLPMRFGAAFSSHAEAQRAIDIQADTLRKKLTKVAGKEQMTLRIVGAPQGAAENEEDERFVSGAPDVSSSGAAYLRARAGRATPPSIVPLLDALKPVVHDTLIETGKTGTVVATVYHLIARGDSTAYREAVTSATPETSPLSIRVSGPAPCYAFT